MRGVGTPTVFRIWMTRYFFNIWTDLDPSNYMWKHEGKNLISVVLWLGKIFIFKEKNDVNVPGVSNKQKLEKNLRFFWWSWNPLKKRVDSGSVTSGTDPRNTAKNLEEKNLDEKS